MTSSDGVRWEVHEDNGTFGHLAGTGATGVAARAEDDGGVIALGDVSSGGRTCPALWRSQDEGASWTRVDLDAGTFAAGDVADVTGAADGLLLATGAGTPDGAPGSGAPVMVWASANGGTHWQRCTPDDAFFTGPYGSGGQAVQVLGDQVLVSAGFAYNKPLVDPVLHPVRGICDAT